LLRRCHCSEKELLERKRLLLGETDDWAEGQGNMMVRTYKPWSEERKRKHSEALMGRSVSKSTREKLSRAMKAKGVPAGFCQKGIAWSEERRQRWSLQQKGKKRKKHTLESRMLMSRIARAKRPAVFTDESKLARNRFEYKLWRKAVYSRDDYTCLKCHIRGGRLNPHHVENFHSNPSLRYDVGNGATLCVLCHKIFHNRYGKKRNNRIQIDEFLNESDMLKGQGFKLLTDGK